MKIQEEPENKKTSSGLTMPNPNVADGIEEAVVITADTDKVSESDRVLIYRGAGKEFENPSKPGERLRTIALNEIIVIL